MASPLREGVYEHPITQELQRGLDPVQEDRQQVERIDDDEGPLVVAKHIAHEVARVLGGVKIAGRAEVARELSDRLLAEIAQFAAERPAIVAELRELHAVLEERVSLASQVFPIPEWPLALHHQYMRREVLTAVGFLRPGQKKHVVPSGILKLEDRQCELLFVTLDKSGTDFSPTTRYRDYAISRERFHWETQGSASASRPSGRRYIESPGNGMTFQLFVRSAPGEPFAYLGPVLHETHEGDRPIAITWRLEHPMPAGLFDRYATLAIT